MSDEQLLALLNMTDDELLQTGALDQQISALADAGNPGDAAMLAKVVPSAANMVVLGPLRQLAFMVAEDRFVLDDEGNPVFADWPQELAAPLARALAQVPPPFVGTRTAPDSGRSEMMVVPAPTPMAIPAAAYRLVVYAWTGTKLRRCSAPLSDAPERTCGRFMSLGRLGATGKYCSDLCRRAARRLRTKVHGKAHYDRHTRNADSKRTDLDNACSRCSASGCMVWHSETGLSGLITC